MLLPLPPIVRELLPHLSVPAGGWLVGGAVRDAVLGREVKDVDLAVKAGALEIGRKLSRELGGAFVPLDEERGCARVVLASSGVVVDVTDLRAGSLEEDLAARDFTINALAVPLDPPHEILDPWGGLDDLRAGRLRTPSPEVLEDDPLRCLRAVRFVGELGFEIEESTRSWIVPRASALGRVAAERIREELLRALSGGRPLRVARELRDLRLFPVLFPDRPEPDLEGFHAWISTGERLAEDELDVMSGYTARMSERLDRSLGESGSHRGLIRLVVLLGLPPLMDLQEILAGLRLSRAAIRWAGRLIEGLTHLEETGRDPDTPLAMHRFYRVAGDAGPEAALLAAGYSTIAGATLRTLLEAWFDRHQEIVDPPVLVSGDDLLDLGIPPGPRIGEILEELREARVEGLVTTREDALDWLSGR